MDRQYGAAIFCFFFYFFQNKPILVLLVSTTAHICSAGLKDLENQKHSENQQAP
jgi:hypothetical protein